MKPACIFLLLLSALLFAADNDSTVNTANDSLITNTGDIIIQNNGSDSSSQTDTSSSDTLDGGAPLPVRKSIQFNAAGFGPANLQNLGSQNLAYNFYGGRIWEVTDYASIKALGETTTDFSESFLIGFNLGTNIYPLTSDISPYIGGEMGFGFSRSGGENALGLSFGLSGGFLFFRKSDVQLNTEVKASVLLDKTGRGYPANYVARLGINF